jgi:beta-xylosidase
MKNNKGRTKKKRVEISSSQFLDIKENQTVRNLILKEIEMDAQILFPTLENNFKRITLVNFEKTERLTIDFDLNFINHETNKERKIENLVIIELKQEGRCSSTFKKIMLDYPIYEKSFSKYCIGTVVTNPIIKSNNFKSRIRFIEKKVNTSFNL